MTKVIVIPTTETENRPLNCNSKYVPNSINLGKGRIEASWRIANKL